MNRPKGLLKRRAPQPVGRGMSRDATLTMSRATGAREPLPVVPGWGSPARRSQSKQDGSDEGATACEERSRVKMNRVRKGCTAQNVPSPKQTAFT